MPAMSEFHENILYAVHSSKVTASYVRAAIRCVVDCPVSFNMGHWLKATTDEQLNDLLSDFGLYIKALRYADDNNGNLTEHYEIVRANIELLCYLMKFAETGVFDENLSEERKIQEAAVLFNYVNEAIGLRNGNSVITADLLLKARLSDEVKFVN